MSNEHSRIERLTGRERRRIRQALLGFALCVAFYSVQYALRSAPTVMLADLARAFNISSVDVGDLSSIFLYTYAIFALISGTVLDRFGARAAVPCGAAITAFGALLFVLDGFGAAEVGRLLQGAGSAFALTGAVYVAASGLPPSRLALAIGIAQAAGMFGAWAGQWLVSVALRTWDVAWQSIWVAVVGILVLLALCIAVSLPGRAPAESQPASVGENAPASVLRPLQILFANPQTWFCAICAGGLFVPTAIGALIWRIPFYSTGLDVPYQQAVLSASMVPLGLGHWRASSGLDVGSHRSPEAGPHCGQPNPCRDRSDRSVCAGTYRIVLGGRFRLWCGIGGCDDSVQYRQGNQP